MKPLVERNQQIMAMRRDGKRLREIAQTFHLSLVRVHLIIKREEKRANLTLTADS